MENEKLTKRQQDLYSYLKKYIQENNHAPTLEEMKQAIEVNFLNSVVQYLKVLEKKGYIIRTKHAERNIALRKSNSSNSITWTRIIPVVSSVGCDNLNVLAREYYDEFIDVSEKLIGRKSDVVAVRAVGNSMNDAGIDDGDYVLVEVTNHAENGDRVVAIVGDMIIVKMLEKKGGLVILRPESKDPKYKSIILHEDFKIAGKVICTIPADNRDISDVVPIKE